MAYIGMAHMVVVYIVMAWIVMVYKVMAYIIMAYVVMAYRVMAYRVMAAAARLSFLPPGAKPSSLCCGALTALALALAHASCQHSFFCYCSDGGRDDIPVDGRGRAAESHRGARAACDHHGGLQPPPIYLWPVWLWRT